MPETSRGVLLDREWLVTNGLGGYASGSVSGAITRKYHGLLIAALPAPLGRMVMWSHVFESLRFADDAEVSLGAEERAGGRLDLSGADYLREFRLEDGLPVWTYQVRDVVIEKRILLPYLQNTVHVSYRMSGSGRLPRLELRPTFQFRHHEAAVDEAPAAPYQLTMADNRYEISHAEHDLPPFRMRLVGCESTFRVTPEWIPQVIYRTEQDRGYAYQGDLWSPGVFEIEPGENCQATMIGSTEEWEIADVLAPDLAQRSEQERRKRLLAQAADNAREGTAAELVFAADQFIIRPAGRALDAARAHATGDEVRTVIAGYHWFTDWGRDTMISLEGLTLTTGRADEAGYILRTFAHYVRDGLIPNMFPDGKNEGLYHTADATLWFFHALGRYLDAGERSRSRCELLLPTLIDIAEAHLRGTKFNIHVDPADGLLVQGQEGYQLTWMDAKMGDWVVTPRRGKAVEINALWFNALKYLEGWLRHVGDEDAANRYAGHAQRARDSFNARFWFAEGGHLYDVIDQATGGDDPACRPNQIFAISLDHPGSRARALGRCGGCRATRIAHARGPAFALAAPSRLQTDLSWRSAHAGRGLSSRHRLGLADRAVHRRLAESASRRAGGRARVPGWFSRPPGRGGHRHDQRSLRRGRAAHAARLHRAGLERGGSAALLGEGGIVAARVA